MLHLGLPEAALVQTRLLLPDALSCLDFRGTRGHLPLPRDVPCGRPACGGPPPAAPGGFPPEPAQSPRPFVMWWERSQKRSVSVDARRVPASR